MKVVHPWILGALTFFFHSTATFSMDPYNPYAIQTYHRFAEVEKECGSLISSAPQLNPDDSRISRIQTQFSFANGDWKQEDTTAPLMPFDDSDMPNSISHLSTPMKLVSFSVTDVTPIRGSTNTISIRGLLYIGISRNCSLPQLPYGRPEFSMRPGMSTLAVPFEGVYIESEKNGGERVMCLLGTSTRAKCLLGTSTLPFPQKPVYHLQSIVSHDSNICPQDTHDDRILLVLHYPKIFTLTSREIYGEMKSLNEQSNPNYFDKVHISSQLSYHSRYQFGSEEVKSSEACNLYPYQDKIIDAKTQNITGPEFCGFFRQLEREIFSIVSHKKCDNTDENCKLFFPFLDGKVINATSGDLQKFKLTIQDARCEPGIYRNMESTGCTARVAATFRAISPTEYQQAAVERTGLSGMTLLAEGTWNSSNGQLCMVGCSGLIPPGAERCDSRICLYFPLRFSITRKSIVNGKMYSISNTHSIPLTFDMELNSVVPWNRYMLYSSQWSYTYSKIELAYDLRDSIETFRYGNLHKKLFLSYPTVENWNDKASLSRLSNDLSLSLNPLRKTKSPRTSVRMIILSLGPLFGLHFYHKKGFEVKETPLDAKVEFIEHKLMNVSAHLTLTGKYQDKFFLEGIYDPLVGKMYLIGCREANISEKDMTGSSNLEGRLDCMVQVKVEYSSNTVSWLISPSADIVISSQRNASDPLHFRSIHLQTPILYQEMWKDDIFAKAFQKILQISLLFVAIGSIFSQLAYIRKNIHLLPYVSLVMLAIQALMFSLPLIMGAEFLFHPKTSQSCITTSYGLEKLQWYQVLDGAMKISLLFAFQLTLRLIHKVRNSRVGLCKRSGVVPSDKHILLCTSAAYMIGFLLLLVQSSNDSYRPLATERYAHGEYDPHNALGWVTELKACMFLVQDFILLPQILANILWKIHGKPLSKVYYIGFTAVRLLLRLYNFTNPTCNPYLSDQDGYVAGKGQLHFSTSNIVISMLIAVLAIIIHIQQSWKH